MSGSENLDLGDRDSNFNVHGGFVWCVDAKVKA
jgi:hypothetical protein